MKALTELKVADLMKEFKWNGCWKRHILLKDGSVHLMLIITDGNPGLNIPRQRCFAHKLRNVAN